ncbi:MAG: VCBS repeat-containing protein [Armatimonadota bacterium]
MGARSLWRTVATLLMLLVSLALPACAAPFETLFEDINPSIGLPGTSGGAWGDYDGDGYPDLFLSASPSFFLNRSDQLFHNNGDLTFTDVSASVGLPPTIEESQGAAWGDYDNDGFLDVIVGCGAAPTKLYDNVDGHFTELATAAGLNPTQRTGRTVAWCDYDGDNWLDVFVCYALTDVSALFHNNHDGTFTDVTAAAGMLAPIPPSAANDCSWADYDNDGHPDLVVSRGSMSTPQRPLLYHNKGDGTFEEVGVQAGIGAVADTLGVAWLDYDNDGWFDLYFCSEQHGRDWLFHNNHDGTFTDVSDAAGLAGDVYKGNSVACADYDNDGFEDIFVGNTEVNQPFLYHNNGDGTFTDVAQSAGLGGSHSNLVAIRADIDLDGKMDLFVGVGEPTSRLFHNIGQTGNWLRVLPLTSATGDATDATKPARDAIGAVCQSRYENVPIIATWKCTTRGRPS